MNDVIAGFFTQLTTWAVNGGIRLLIALVLLVIGWKFTKKLSKVFNAVLNKKKVDSTLVSFLESFVDISLKVILVILFIGFIGIDTTALAGIVASAGLAIGLALQGSLGNFAGGVIILFIRPFNVGDFIDAAGHSGTVEKIGIFYTHLVTPDNKEILIPNGMLTGGSLTNYSSKELRRVDITFGVSYDDNLGKVKQVLDRIISSNALILKTPEPFVAINSYEDSSINFVVRVWCNNKDYWNIYFDLMNRVKDEFDKEGISIPYPQMDLHIANNEDSKKASGK